MEFERLYDESERANVQFVGMTTEYSRYDFAIVYTNLFFGKPLITCMQSGRSCLLNREDLDDTEYVRKTFRVTEDADVESLREFFLSVLPPAMLEPQY
ncbi:DUF3055 domain-containing protein [Salisediminibacterium halotolerans]|uniref:DUF3055 domain-containing protein n=1 Tax=Salisediminibacterium halotolerans TaxID=517425 RepID=A0A1H9WVI6_9BACI|nr:MULTISPECIES: DUF3055 domain-containing protein [Salisediminibacterium]RLJ74350.1 Protein of unknown function (DUF3055) [Actinophytocola xinjiangensis]RPE87557.1 DUF3055 family protein [Salisediminibacterium halotolerans]TWG35187.1 Protein of unknown function (DUF3055) [Salisediminibacterium halotolerans]SES37926.1 Protein of unknown function [Salisediminibacterium haloalkalitolerans]GEL08875.1 hypothetical protein SHA02_22910 [Salisediminibacterium halotolerans]